VSVVHSWDYVSGTSSSSTRNSSAAPEPVTLIGLTSLWINGRPLVPPRLNQRRASLVLSKIDEILDWEKNSEREREPTLSSLVGISVKCEPANTGA
jgi:hypothetical protein